MGPEMQLPLPRVHFSVGMVLQPCEYSVLPEISYIRVLSVGRVLVYSVLAYLMLTLLLVEIFLETTTYFGSIHISVYSQFQDLPCGLVIRVPGYGSRGPGSIPSAIRFSDK
jgi:hypothetical protein